MKDTHICINCEIKQLEPQSPLKWCAYCFQAKLILLSEVNTRFFSEGAIGPKEVTLKFIGTQVLGRVESVGTGRYHLDLTSEDIDLLITKLKQMKPYERANVLNRNMVIHKLAHVHALDERHVTFPIKSGFIFFRYSSKHDAYTIGMIGGSPKARVNNNQLIHKIPTDNLGMSERLLSLALEDRYSGDSSNLSNVFTNWFYLTPDDVEYIKTITGYKDEKFTFE